MDVKTRKKWLWVVTRFSYKTCSALCRAPQPCFKKKGAAKVQNKKVSKKWWKGQEEDKEEETKSLKTDSWAAFKLLYVSSASPRTQKEMLGSSPSGLLKKYSGQIVPSSPWLLVLFFLSPSVPLNISLSFTGSYLSWLHQGSIINSHLGGPGAGRRYNGPLVQRLLFQWKTTPLCLRARPRPHEGIPFIW